VDYFVFGIGFGASLVLAGWALRQYGPGLRFRQANSGKDVLRAAEMLVRHDWTRFCISLGGLLSIAGTLLLASTVITLLIRPSDRTGAIVSVILFGLVLLGVAIWIGVFLSQHQRLGFRRDTSSRAFTAANHTDESDRYLDLDRREPDEAGAEETEDQIAAQVVTPASSMSLRHQQNRRRIGPIERQASPVEVEVDAENIQDEGKIDLEQSQEPGPILRTDSTASSALGGIRFSRPPQPANTGDQQVEQDGPVSTDEPGHGVASTAPDSDASDSPESSQSPDANRSRSQPGDVPKAATTAESELASGEDVVSSVTIRETPAKDVSVSHEEAQEPASTSDAEAVEDKDEPISTVDAYGRRDTALANLRMRRGDRFQTQHRDDSERSRD